MSKLTYNAETPLYTSDKRGWRLDEFDALMDEAEASGRPTVFFVHGRGKEPNKSLNGGQFTVGMAVHKLELGYDVNVIMFNWNSAFKGLNFLDREVPISHTGEAATTLGKMLDYLAQRQARLTQFKRPSLLTHSMGAIVVQKAVEQGSWPARQPLFSNVLFTQPDCDDVGHSTWLQSLALREKVLVTVNADDHVLRRSNDGRPAHAHALGLGTDQPLATNASYVDLSRIGPTGLKDEDHEVFGKGAMNGQLNVCKFFEQSLTGREVVLTVGDNVDTLDRGVLFRLKDRFEPGAPCLVKPVLPVS